MIVTVVEFIGSWILEKFFNMKLWDYSTLPFNIEGRVAVPVSLFWGVGCIILIKLVNPPVQNWIHDFNELTHSWGVILILMIFLADLVSTFIFTISTKKEVLATIDDSDKENAAIKEFRLKHLFANHETAENRIKELELLKNLSLIHI